MLIFDDFEKLDEIEQRYPPDKYEIIIDLKHNLIEVINSALPKENLNDATV